MTDSKDYLDEVTSQTLDGRPPDFFMIHKTRPPHDEIVGNPIAVYQNKKSLYDNFDDHAEDTDSKFGITVGVYWFDDPK